MKIKERRRNKEVNKIDRLVWDSIFEWRVDVDVDVEI